MTSIETQVTVIQIDNYGPWTVTPSPKREADLQMLQSQLYADIAQVVAHHDGYVFATRYDNMIAITNGLDLEAHRRIQDTVRNRYPVTVSLGVATGASPREAVGEATSNLQAAGSAQDGSRTEILRSDPPCDEGTVQIAHFDVNDATERYTDEFNAFEVFRRIDRGYTALLEHMYDAHDSLSFFIGGDNIISVTAGLDRAAFDEAIDHVAAAEGIELKVGVGRDRTAGDAGMTAKEALERCRECGTRVEIGTDESARRA
ncbi:GTP cyclohydrolase IIa [Natrinema sp. 1APR25-10V2]|uniref:GTP cyclohydrolase IIa n=1 Tax=Natrinema sp. 1APR25-10V2 TaxID=2951081 RepID=UPI0028761D7C|nr:GTP cyclohydrolase IIa [Natrinema sp. 1APR25-10V2]MDS0476347.1 GTP cyclohydrolase IIa [Natrinema sp. 1APR25-10V2]